MVRTKEWKLIMAGNANHQLFHLTSDPGEMKNLYAAENHAAIRRELLATLKQHMEQIGDPALKGSLKDYLA
jgi:arylsulfatase A-like enzyme